MKKDENILGTYPIGKLLLKLSIPTVIAQLINMLYNIVDRIYIGHIPVEGSLALTGVGVCLPIIMIVTAFAALVSSGGAPRASIFSTSTLLGPVTITSYPQEMILFIKSPLKLYAVLFFGETNMNLTLPCPPLGSRLNYRISRKTAAPSFSPKQMNCAEL